MMLNFYKEWKIHLVKLLKAGEEIQIKKWNNIHFIEMYRSTYIKSPLLKYSGV